MPHRDLKDAGTRLRTWIIMIPLMKEGSWLYEYNKEFTHKFLRIPLGGYLVLRDYIFHGGCDGCEGNVRMQITLLPKSDVDKF